MLYIIVQTAKRFKRSIVLSAYMYVGAILTILSSLYLDFGIYSVDIDKVTSNNFSGFFYFVFVFPVLYIFSSLTNNINLKAIRYDRSVLYFVNLILVLLLLNYFSSPKPYFDDSITRLNYWESSQAPWLRQLVGNISSFIAVIVGLFYYNDKNRKYIFIFAIYLLYLILIGQKGGALFEVIIYFIFPFSFDFLVGYPLKKLLLPLIIASLLILGVAYYSYNNFNPYAHITDSVVESLIYRMIALQNALTSYSVDRYLFKIVSLRIW